MLLRQLPAAASRSAGLIGNWMSLSASAKVDAETGGPTSGAAPKVGGAPGVASPVFCSAFRQAVLSAARPADALRRKRRRDLTMDPTIPQRMGANPGPDRAQRLWIPVS